MQHEESSFLPLRGALPLGGEKLPCRIPPLPLRGALPLGGEKLPGRIPPLPLRGALPLGGEKKVLYFLVPLGTTC
jgi:hypothetical protein